MGCPLNAKQSMLVTTIPAALDRGATLVYRARVTRLVVEGEHRGLRSPGVERNGAATEIRWCVCARHYVLAAGAIGSPGVLLASGMPDPHSVAGKRTFLHPTVVCGAVFPQKVEAHAGAPQTIYSDHFLEGAPLQRRPSSKAESARPLERLIRRLPSVLPDSHFAPLPIQWLTRARDAFPGRPGASGAASDWPVLDYPITDYLWNGARAYSRWPRSSRRRRNRSCRCTRAQRRSRLREARASIEGLPMRPLQPGSSAPMMAAARWARTPDRWSTRPDGTTRSPTFGARCLGLPDQPRGQPAAHHYASPRACPQPRPSPVLN